MYVYKCKFRNYMYYYISPQKTDKLGQHTVGRTGGNQDKCSWFISVLTP